MSESKWRRARAARGLGVIAASFLSVHCGDGGDQGREALALCHAPASVDGAPRTIEDVTALVNALADEHGGTVDLPCFVSSLSRPIGAAASEGVFSEQPAVGARSPRMFLWSGGLVMTVAPEGAGRNLLELGFETAPTRSLKAEIEFPVTAPLSTAAPYEQIRVENRTKCAVCHADERPAARVDWAQAFESDMLRPAEFEEVDLEEFARESKGCDPALEPQRCALLGAIFDQGGVHPRSFPAEASTIYPD